jgi:hypothetical protein
MYIMMKHNLLRFLIEVRLEFEAMMRTGLDVNEGGLTF